MCVCVWCVCIDIEPCVASHFVGICNKALCMKFYLIVLCVTMHMHFCVYIENHATWHIRVTKGALVGGKITRDGKCMALVDLYIVHPH